MRYIVLCAILVMSGCGNSALYHRKAMTLEKDKRALLLVSSGVHVMEIDGKIIDMHGKHILVFKPGTYKLTVKFSYGRTYSKSTSDITVRMDAGKAKELSYMLEGGRFQPKLVKYILKDADYNAIKL